MPKPRSPVLLPLLLAACSPDAPLPGPAGEGAVHPVHLIPRPVSLAVAPGARTLGGGTRIVAGGPARAVAERLALDLRPSTGLALPVEADGSADSDDIRLDIDGALPPGAYTLDADRDGIRLVAGDPAGLHAATATLRQLLPPAALADTPGPGPWTVPHVAIDDAPAFPWRGHMLDVARHFFTVDEVKRQLDAMALYKLNVLHLHLTDDAGWRIEIEGWPRLTEVGGATEVGGGPGGFYTQADYAEIVEHAASRGITVVPEIDFPGHCHAALASYPELNEGGETPEPFTGVGVGFSTLWLEGPDTHRFVEEVWAEVAALTPGELVHIGADESDATDPADYAAFVPWLQGVLEAQGKRVIGWDEVSSADLDPPFLAQHWEDEDRARAAVAGGGQLVRSPAEHAYLDMIHDWEADFGSFWAGPTSVSDGYLWEPVPAGLTADDVVGVEAPLWTEYVETEAQLQLMTWPRLAGIAELGWAGGPEAFEDYAVRLGAHGPRLRALGVAYYRSEEVPWAE